MPVDTLHSLRIAYAATPEVAPSAALAAALRTLSSRGIAQLNDELAELGVSVDQTSGKVTIPRSRRAPQAR
ncbi:hypothetical protein HYN69_04195 [Gemmobacter aquarius]|uniref:Uncharacterized protein n=1 Tax=Paragemmobacter aquarius TaxID=2169400 RepID=A0A2S0UJ05_9RHOB|nr:hypothetical protein [Gemmobacter aquarius]AWB47817.1 hypothetical protein HYN69_04195 [Gemmobacter aquarius]